MDTTLKRRSGIVLTALVAVFLVIDGAINLLFPSILAQDMTVTGWPVWTGPIIGVISLVSGLFYAIPRTAILGAILTTGFLGGAIATHLRLEEVGSPPQIISLAVGLTAWGALWLRERVS